MREGPYFCHDAAVSELSQRLRRLDRRVLREDRLESPAGWAKAMGRWRWTLALAIFYACGVGLAQLFWPGREPGLLLLLPGSVGMAFMAGQMRAEHGRINGDSRIAGKRRPPGV